MDQVILTDQINLSMVAFRVTESLPAINREVHAYRQMFEQTLDKHFENMGILIRRTLLPIAKYKRSLAVSM